MRILYIHATFVPPPLDPRADRFVLLSEVLDGDVLQPIWFSRPEQVEEVFGPGSYPVYTAGRFRYHWFLSERYRGARQRLETFRFYLRKGWEVYRQRRYRCIVAYSHMTTGLMAGLLKMLTRTRLIIEIVTAPHLVSLVERPRPTWKERAMHGYSNLCLHLSMWIADRAHFLFPDQLSSYSLLRRKSNSMFHEFVPVSTIECMPAGQKPAPYILLVGAPWFLKGVDLLIEAFLNLAPDFPEWQLKILGYYEDSEQLKTLTRGSPGIEILKARPNPEALQIIRAAQVMALPSRCEGLPRVLIEGMAAGLPLVGSDVAGIPFLIRAGENGYVVPSGDSAALEQRLRELLSDPARRCAMGEQSYRRAHCELNEETYVRQFAQMVRDTIQDDS